jgi:arabinose-5-phosphate isomerase
MSTARAADDAVRHREGSVSDEPRADGGTTTALAPTTLAMTLLVRKGFREDQFASLHPGGKIGRRLMRVEHVMHAGDAAPVVRTTTKMPDVFHEMSSKRLGMTCVVDVEGRLVGVFTDGDLRRLMSRVSNVLTLTAAP